MARCPFAHWRPLPENTTEPPIVATQLVFHTAVDHPGRTYLGGYFDNPGVNVESHFYVYLDGDLEQYVDTSRSADAQYNGNRRSDGTGALSVETEDDGDPSRPWSDAQLDTLERLGRWVLDNHPQVAARVCRRPDDPGLGYHSMWGAPSEWTPAKGKVCPGPARIGQFPALVDRIVQEDDMPLNDDDLHRLRVMVREELDRHRSILSDVFGRLRRGVRKLLDKAGVKLKDGP